MMSEQGIPLTKENVMRMNQALKLTDSMEKALFLFTNDFRLTQVNVNHLNQLLDGYKIPDAITRILTALQGLDTPTAARLLQIFTQAAQGQAAVPGQSHAATTQPAAAPGSPITSPGLPANASGSVAPGSTPTSIPQTPLPSIPSVIPPGLGNAASAAPPPPASILGQQSQVPASSTMPTNIPNAPNIVLTAPIPQTTDNTPIPPSVVGEPTPPSAGTGNQAVAAPGQAPANTGLPDRAIPLPESINLPTDPAQPAHAGIPARNSAVEQHLPRLSLSLTADNGPQQIDRFINSLQDALHEAQRVLADTRADSPAAARVFQEIQALANHLDFIAQIRNPLFAQIPLFHNGQEMQAALHILRNPKRERDGKKGSSALIALDTAFLGLFETLVSKNDSAVQCQFRLRDKKVEQAVRANIHKLEALLREHHYSLSAFSFLPAGEPYSVLDSPGLLKGETENTAVEMVSFDKRA
jgi:hypothetical protein